MVGVIKKYLPVKSARQMKKVWQQIQRVYYTGNTYYCPFCDNNYRKFRAGGFNLPVNRELRITGAGYRKNMLCPGCYSTDRDRLLYLFLKNQTDILYENCKVLHIAPEGALAHFLSGKKNIDYTIGTKYHEGIYYPGNIDLIDITRLEYKSNTFDAIICNHVLEHIPEDMTAMKELFRVLKPGGWAILQVPVSKKLEHTFEDPSIVSPVEREKHFGQFDHVRIYGQDYPERLKKAGFIVEQHHPVKDNWQVKDLNKYAVNEEEIVYVANKRGHE